MKLFFKKNLILTIVCIVFLNFTVVYADDIDIDITEDECVIETASNDIPNLTINARSCIVLDRLSKKILYGKNEFNKVKMASTTKIMTATVIIENCDLNQTVVVSRKAAGTVGSRLGLKNGDKITIRDLLYGLMLCSGNDAAVALAESCSGSISEFCNLMNQKAEELGLNNSHFETPHGLDSENHYTTAYELAMLSDYALQNKTFFNIVGTKNYTVTINGYPKALSNTNELLGNLFGVYGIKTGFTNGANRCLVTSCKRDNMDIICVVLGCDTKKLRTQDSIKLIEYAFKNFEYVNIEEKINNEFEDWKNKNYNKFNIYKGVSSKIDLKLSNLDTSIIPIKKEEISLINININCNINLKAPVRNSTIIGELTVSINDDLLTSVNIFNTNTISKKNILNYLFELLSGYSSILNTLFE